MRPEDEQDDESEVETFPLDGPPGVVFGPYESLTAILIWFADLLKGGFVRETPLSRLSQALRVHPQLRKRILDAYVLHGKLDVLAGMHLVDTALASAGVGYSRREIVGDLLSFDAPSPFCHSIEVGWLAHLGFDFGVMQADDRRVLTTACVRAMTRAGYKGFRQFHLPSDPLGPLVSVRESVKRVLKEAEAASDEAAPLALRALGSAGNTLTSTIAAIDRSLIFGVPLWSKDLSGPAWTSSTLDDRFRILQLVYDEVIWLPRPTTFVEAASMNADQRLVELRHYIRELNERALTGDLENERELLAEIRKRVSWFKTKSWASRFGKLIAFAALPVELAGLAVGRHEVGPIVAGVGFATEWIATRIEKTKKKSWLSIVPGKH